MNATAHKPSLAALCACAWLGCAALAHAASPAPSGAPPATPDPSANAAPAIAPSHALERTLANGLKVVVKPDRRAPTVVHMLWYRVGGIDEVSGITGVSHVLEHMMFKGTKRLQPGEFSRRVAEMGGSENAFTSRDYTGYFQQIHRSRLREVMELEADRMTNLVLTQPEFERELRVVMEERRWRTEDRATSLAYEQLMAHAFIASPYRSPVVGWMKDLEAMTLEDIQAWYTRWYAPNNAVLVVAGDVDPAQVFAWAEQTYGKAEKRELWPRKPQTEPPQRGIKRIEVKAPAENPMVMLAYKVPKLEQVDGETDAFALEVLSSVLDAYDGARLSRNIVRGSRVANQAGAGYDMTQRGPALFYLEGTPAEGSTTEQVERALRAEIEKIASEGVSDTELKRIIAQYVSSQVYKRDSLMAQAMELGQLEMVGLSHRDADRILERIRRVTPEQVKAVAAKYFGEDSLTVVTLVPQPSGERRAAPPPGLRH